METLEYKTIDKSDWGGGPWQDEPDKRQWQDEATGLPCMFRRVSHSGALCGYVGVPFGHPAYGQGCDDVDVDVHGGLNFANKCQPGDESETICHIVGPGESDDVWWLGFDCAHYMDFSPAMAARYREMGMAALRIEETYRDVPYIVEQVTYLAAQLKAMVS